MKTTKTLLVFFLKETKNIPVDVVFFIVVVHIVRCVRSRDDVIAVKRNEKNFFWSKINSKPKPMSIEDLE